MNVVKKIGHTAKKVGQAIGHGAKKVWKGVCSIFGRSAFILDLDNGMVLGYIRGGKGGQKLCDEHYIVEQFGPILTVNAIGVMAHDIHKHYKSCIDAQDDERAESSDEVDGVKEELDKRMKEGLDELKGKAEELAEKLTIEADKVLTVTEVCIKVTNSGENNISVGWFVYNPEEDTFYNEDKGDIEYHVKVTATVIEGDNVKTISIYDDIFAHKIKKKEENSEKENNDVTLTTEVCQPQITEVVQDDMLHSTEDQSTTEQHNTVEATQDEMMQREDTSNGQNVSETSLSSQGTEELS